MGNVKQFFGKMLLKLFKLSDYKAFMDTFGSYFGGGGDGNYKDWVYEAIDTWGLYFAKAKFRLYKKEGKNLYEVNKHPLINIFKQPNEWQSIWELKYKLAPAFGLYGNAYWYKLREPLFNMPVGIYPLNPQYITPRSSKDKFLAYYEYNVGKEIIEIKPEDLIHFRYPDPASEICGRAIIKNIMDDVEVSRYQAQYQNQFYKSGGFLGLTFSTNASMKPNEFNKLKAALEEKYGSGVVEKNFKVALLDNGLQPVKAAYSMKDMDITGISKISREKILGAFKVPEGLLGIGGDYNRATFDGLVMMFTSLVIDPLLDYVDDVLTQNFTPDFGEQYLIKHDVLAPKDVEAALKYYKDMTAIGAMTIDEVREEEGWNPFGLPLTQTPLIQGGGVLFDLANERALGQTLNEGEKGNNKPEKRVSKEICELRFRQFERRRQKIIESKKEITDKDYIEIIREGFKHATLNLGVKFTFEDNDEFIIESIKNIKEKNQAIEFIVTSCLNAGQLYAFKRAGIKNKSWLSESGDGELVGVDEKFSNGLMYPDSKYTILAE